MNARLPYKKQTSANRLLLRRQAVELCEKGGVGASEVARRIGVTRQSIHNWVAAFRENGEEGLLEEKRGRPCALDEDDRERLAELLDRGAQASGYEDDRWTLSIVGDLIKHTFGVCFSIQGVCDLLHAMGYSHQKARRQARERDEEAIEDWKRNTFPALGKKNGKRGENSGLYR